jgi:hypothetical protein
MSFTELIKRGDFIEIKKFLSDNPEYDITSDNDYAFRWSCALKP